MRVAAGLALAVTLMLAAPRAYDYEQARAAGPPRVNLGDGTLLAAIRHHRVATWRCQQQLGRARTRTEYAAERSPSLAFRKWTLRLWRQRAGYECNLARQLTNPVRAIYAVFGAHGAAAVRVAYCETGGTFNVYASNGQYKGIFQMGSHERATYGHGWTPLEQARAAYRYFRAAGGWGPWECRP